MQLSIRQWIALVLLDLRRLIAIPTILLVTNLVFVTCFIAYAADPSRNYRRTTCGSAYDRPLTCTWIDGRMTSEGAWQLAKFASILVGINLFCVLVVLPFGRSRPDGSIPGLRPR